jgi:hypothetical protein
MLDTLRRCPEPGWLARLLNAPCVRLNGAVSLVALKAFRLWSIAGFCCTSSGQLELLVLETLRSGGAAEEELAVGAVGRGKLGVVSVGDTSLESGSLCAFETSRARNVERGEMGTSDCGAPAAVDG